MSFERGVILWWSDLILSLIKSNKLPSTYQIDWIYNDPNRTNPNKNSEKNKWFEKHMKIYQKYRLICKQELSLPVSWHPDSQEAGRGGTLHYSHIKQSRRRRHLAEVTSLTCRRDRFDPHKNKSPFGWLHQVRSSLNVIASPLWVVFA